MDHENENWIGVKVSRCGQIISVYQNDASQSDINTKYGVPDILDSIFIDVPIPFKNGDLVEIISDGPMFGIFKQPYGGVYVLQGTVKEFIGYTGMLFRTDIMDMTADVFYEVNGSVECECIHFYPDLQYCRRELDGEKRILKYISLYEQEKICLCSLLKIQKLIMLDETIDHLKSNYNLHKQLEQINDKLLEGSVANKEDLLRQGIIPIEPEQFC